MPPKPVPTSKLESMLEKLRQSFSIHTELLDKHEFGSPWHTRAVNRINKIEKTMTNIEQELENRKT